MDQGELSRMLAEAKKMRERALTPEQAERRAAVDARNAAIQRVGPKPKDGVTFGKKAKS